MKTNQKNTAFILTMLSGTALCVWALGACVSEFPLEEKACPCSEGWTCCADQNVCIRASQRCETLFKDPTRIQADLNDSGVSVLHRQDTLPSVLVGHDRCENPILVSLDNGPVVLEGDTT